MINLSNSFEDFDFPINSNNNNNNESVVTTNDDVDSCNDLSLRTAGIYDFQINFTKDDEIVDLSNNNIKQLETSELELNIPSNEQIFDYFANYATRNPKNVGEARDILAFKYSSCLKDLDQFQYTPSEFTDIEKHSNNFFKTRSSGKAKYPEFNQVIAKKNDSINRWADVLPYDKNTYQVAGFDNPYINASQIEVNGKEYIACSAPLTHTFDKFWQMIVDSGCDNVVMLTKFLEKRRVKAHCYWPGKVGEDYSFGKVKVTLTDSEASLDNELTKRTFSVVDLKTNEERTITHWHFTGWPDYGVTSPEVFDSLINKVNENAINGPLIVHCSGGIGRAGTFITTHSLYDELNNDPNKVFSIAERVFHLRSQRNHMVQTKDQYKLIYATIRHHAQN